MTNKFEKNTNCEYCGKALDAKYRTKRFCDDKCRIYLDRENKRKMEVVVEDAMNKKAEETTVFVSKDLKEKVDVAFKEKVFSGNPKTLDELKALCPHPKGTDEFREWVRTERQKYNI